MGILSVISIIVYLLVPWPKVSAATAAYFIDQNQSMSDGMTLVSQNGTFELGFFSPGDSKSRYLGIWYKNIPIQTVVWVANRENSVTDSSSILKINSSGHLVLSQNDTVVWFSIHGGQAKNAVAYLSNSGNFVVRDKVEVNPEVYLWQSFDYATDTLLPSMKLGWDLRIGLNRLLTAWKSPDDPSPGDLSWGYDVLSNYPESYMMKGKKILFRAGPWNGLYPSGCPELFIHNVFSSKDEM